MFVLVSLQDGVQYDSVDDYCQQQVQQFFDDYQITMFHMAEGMAELVGVIKPLLQTRTLFNSNALVHALMVPATVDKHAVATRVALHSCRSYCLVLATRTCLFVILVSGKTISLVIIAAVEFQGFKR